MTSTMTYVREGVRESGVAARQRRPVGTHAVPEEHPALASSNPQRLLNLVVAGLGLLLALPVMLVVALATLIVIWLCVLVGSPFFGSPPEH